MVDDTSTLGVDLAAQPKQTAVCMVDWRQRPARVRELSIGLDDAAIIDFVDECEPAKMAIDAPFGWPAPFVAAVTQHAKGEPWEAQTVGSLRLRATDLHVTNQIGLQPLSVSADRIAVTAFRCAGLLTALARADRKIDRAGPRACGRGVSSGSTPTVGNEYSGIQREQA